MTGRSLFDMAQKSKKKEVIRLRLKYKPYINEAVNIYEETGSVDKVMDYLEECEDKIRGDGLVSNAIYLELGNRFIRQGETENALKFYGEALNRSNFKGYEKIEDLLDALNEARYRREEGFIPVTVYSAIKNYLKRCFFDILEEEKDYLKEDKRSEFVSFLKDAFNILELPEEELKKIDTEEFDDGIYIVIQPNLRYRFNELLYNHLSLTPKDVEKMRRKKQEENEKEEPQQ